MNNKLTLNYILFLVLSFLIIFGYSYLFPPQNSSKIKNKEQLTSKTEPADKASTDQGTSPHLAINIDNLKTSTDKLVTVETPLYIAKLDEQGLRIAEWKLKKYKEEPTPDSPLVNLMEDPKQTFLVPIKIKGKNLPQIIPFNYSGPKNIKVTDTPKTLKFEYEVDPNTKITATLTFDPDTYILKESYTLENKASEKLEKITSILAYGTIANNGRGANNHSFELMIDGKAQRIDKDPEEPKSFRGQINWFGFSERYFSKIALPENGAVTTLDFKKLHMDSNLFVAKYLYPQDVIPQKVKYSKTWKIYLGPKDPDSLAKAGYGLENIVNYGWIDFLAKIALKFLKIINSYVGNYGLSIIAITVILRLVFLPLTLKSMRSMKEMQQKMQELKPKIDALKEKYKDDKAKQNAELMKLYTSHGVNPLSSLGGCLPLLIQIPVFIALYDVLLYSIELRHSSFLWIKDLSQPEQLFDIPGIGIPFRILPLLMGVSWFFAQKLTPTASPTNESMELQAKLMQFMPIIFTVMFWGLPSGLILYWTVSNILSIIQQLYINRRVHG